MFCKYCGKEIEDGKEVCQECASNEKKVDDVKTEEVVVETPKVENNSNNANTNTNTNTNTNYTVNNTNTAASNQKSKLAAGLFGIFLGVFGVHNFYLGFTGKAVAQLLITVLSCGGLSPISAIWGLIEGILILTGDSSKDAYGNDLKQ